MPPAISMPQRGSGRSLQQVTLCCVDTRAPALALHALHHSMQRLEFARVVLFTHDLGDLPLPPGIEAVDIGPIQSGADYSAFVLKRLPALVDTDFVLVVQWDGYVADASAWRDEFLQYDYIGAPWPDRPPGRRVGNGGFSLRSRRLMQAGLDPRISQLHPEDQRLAVDYRDLLEQDHGVRFAPEALARSFAYENHRPRGPVLGFHGVYHLPALLSAPELASCLDALPEAFYAGRDARRLARSLLRHRQYRLTEEVVRRRAAAGRREPSTRVLGWLAGCLRRWGG